MTNRKLSLSNTNRLTKINRFGTRKVFCKKKTQEKHETYIDTKYKSNTKD